MRKKVRIGYIGHFGRYHTEPEVARALMRAGIEVDCYHYDRIHHAAFTARAYDVCLTPIAHSQPPDFWRRQAGVRIAHYFDLVVGWQRRENIYFPALKDFHLVFSPDGFDGSAYEKAGIRRRYLRQAYDPEVHYPAEGVRPVRDVGFIGHARDARRRALFAELARRFDFDHVGDKNECRGPEHATFCAECRVMLAMNAREDVPGYWSVRVSHHLGSRAFVLHPKVPGIERYYEDGVHLVLYKDTADLIEKIEYYLPRSDERERIARAGYELARSRDTWDERVKEIINCASDLSDTRTRRAVSECSHGSSSAT